MLRKFFISPDESGGELWENCQTHQVRSHRKASGLRVETFYKTFQDLPQIQALLTLSRGMLYGIGGAKAGLSAPVCSRRSAA